MLRRKTVTFEEWWKKTYQRKPTHGPCCTCQDCGQFYENDCRCDCKDVAEAAWDTVRKSVLTYVAEAEYAMVGGNDIKENIGWDTADGWFRWIYKKVWGE